MDRAETLIKRGISELMDNLETEDLLRSEVIRPMELLSLIMQDRIAGRKWNLPETYKSSMKTLVSRIRMASLPFEKTTKGSRRIISSTTRSDHTSVTLTKSRRRYYRCFLSFRTRRSLLDPQKITGIYKQQRGNYDVSGRRTRSTAWNSVALVL
jgi:hypothetical protein